MSEVLRQAARNIFAEALRAVDVRNAVRGAITVKGDVLEIGDCSMPLAAIDCVLLVAIGKAAESEPVA